MGATAKASSQYTPQEMEEGAKIAEAFLRAWTEAKSMPLQAGDDVVMSDASDEYGEELEGLKRCYEQFRSQIEGNPWCREILQSF